MESKLFEQVLKECNFANLPSKYDEPMKEASKSIDFHFDKVGKDCFKISVKKEKYQEVRCGYYTGKLSQKLLTYAVKLNKKQYACSMYHDLIRNLTSFNTELPQIKIQRRNKC